MRGIPQANDCRWDIWHAADEAAQISALDIGLQWGTVQLQTSKAASKFVFFLSIKHEAFYFKLAEEHGFAYETYSDVECILHLYQTFGIEKCVKGLDGVFAFCIVDVEKKKVLLGRDPYGVRPLFKLTTPGGVLAICSEAKGLHLYDSY